MSGEPEGTWHLVWQKGGNARFVKVAETAVTLVSTIPSPPGSRIDASFVDDVTVSFRVKIHGSKKQPDGTFVLEGRPIDMTKDVRTKAAELVARDTTA